MKLNLNIKKTNKHVAIHVSIGEPILLMCNHAFKCVITKLQICKHALDPVCAYSCSHIAGLTSLIAQIMHNMNILLYKKCNFQKPKAYIPLRRKIPGVGAWRWAMPQTPEFCVGDTNMLVYFGVT